VQARLLAKYLPEIIGAKVVVQNEPAGGGKVILNQMFTTIKPDGLSLAFQATGGIWPGYMLSDSSVQYDITKFQYMGGLQVANFFVGVATNSKYKTVEDLKKGKELNFAATTRAAAPTLASALAIDFLGLDAKIVTGFDGTPARLLAVQQDDCHATVSTSDTMMKALKDKVLVPVVQVGTERTKPGEQYPAMMEFVKADSMTDTQKKLLATRDMYWDAKVLFAPPGTPRDRIDFIESAFKKALDTTNLSAEIEKATDSVMQPFVGSAELSKRANGLAAGKADMKLWDDLLNKYVK
jgi:tripartite-type tricarboxylate transporter receptor subunit TctC